MSELPAADRRAASHATVHVAIVQDEVAPTLADGLALTDVRTREAAAAGAALVVYPETWLPGYPAWLDCCRDVGIWDHAPTKAVFRRMFEQSVVVQGPAGEALSRIALSCGVTLVIGVTERVEAGIGRGTLFNSLLTYGPDGVLLNHHRKLVPTFTERMVWGPGDANGLRAVDSPAGRVGGLICWEHWMPLARQALHESAEALHVAVWPAALESHQVASRHYAFEGRTFVLVAGALLRAEALPPELAWHPDKVQSADQWVLRGGSAIIGPDGQYVAAPVYDTATIVHAELDLGRVREESMTLDVTGHYHRPDCFSFETIRTPRRS